LSNLCVMSSLQVASTSSSLFQATQVTSAS
jgi:hypothetical protein